MDILKNIVVILISIVANILVLAAALWILSDKKNNPFRESKKKSSHRRHRSGGKATWLDFLLELPDMHGFGVTMAKCAALVVTIEILRLTLNPILGLADSTMLVVVWAAIFICAWFGGVMCLFGWNVGQALALAIALFGLRLWVGVLLSPLT
jgi:hypothetical protein